MYEIMVCPVKQLYQIALDADMCQVAVIAVSSYGVDKARLSGLWDVLALDFDDVTGVNSVGAFTLSHAQQIADFVDQLPEELDTLFVCCDYGESRSAAMAAAILRYKKADDMMIWKNPKYHPNGFVYGRLCEAFGIMISEQEVQRNIQINEQVFKLRAGLLQ